MKTSLVLLSALSIVLAAPLPEKLAVQPMYLPMVDSCNGDALEACPTKRDADAHVATPQNYGLTENIYSSTGHQNPPSKRAAPLYSSVTNEPCIDGHPCPTEKRDARLATPESYGLTQNIYSSTGHQNPQGKRAVPLYSSVTNEPCVDGHPCPTEKRNARLATPESYGLTQNIYSSTGHQNPPSKA